MHTPVPGGPYSSKPLVLGDSSFFAISGSALGKSMRSYISSNWSSIPPIPNFSKSRSFFLKNCCTATFWPSSLIPDPGGTTKKNDVSLVSMPRFKPICKIHILHIGLKTPILQQTINTQVNALIKSFKKMLSWQAFTRRPNAWLIFRWD